MKGQRNRGKPQISWEKVVEDRVASNELAEMSILLYMKRLFLVHFFYQAHDPHP